EAARSGLGTLAARVGARVRGAAGFGVRPRGPVSRVSAPRRSQEDGGYFLLRHLSEEEAEDAVHPDEFRQRFAAVAGVRHPHIAGVREVLEIAGRPAALQEWVKGLPGTDWPALAAVPGGWYPLARPG